MAMSDCAKCWDTPCSCGWDYRNWPMKRRIEQAAVVLGMSPGELCLMESIPDEHPMKGQK